MPAYIVTFETIILYSTKNFLLKSVHLLQVEKSKSTRKLQHSDSQIYFKIIPWGRRRKNDAEILIWPVLLNVFFIFKVWKAGMHELTLGKAVSFRDDKIG